MLSNKTSVTELRDIYNACIVHCNLVPRLSINVGKEKRVWYQTYAHALDNAVFISSVTVRVMRYDVFAEHDVW